MEILILYKGVDKGKTRLGVFLNPEERARLSMAMFLDLLTVLRNAGKRFPVSVLTADAEVARIALSGGFGVVPEGASGMNAAIDRFARTLASRGVESLLVLPADLPALQWSDVEALAAACTTGITIVPAATDGGTNAIATSPPDVVEFRFGKDSARNHLLAADRRAVPVRIMQLPNLLRDMDRFEDLGWFMQNPCPGLTLACLKESGMGASALRYAKEKARFTEDQFI